MTTTHSAAGARTVTEPRHVERFIIRKNSEWAFAYVDEETGVFSCYSSYGTYAYCWAHRGGETLREFLLDLNFDYFMGKTRGRDYLRFDAEATINGIKTYIMEQRRSGDLTKNEARSAWEDADALDGQTGEAFFNDFCSMKSLMKVYHGDYCDISCEAPASDCVGFWKILWPEIIAALAKKGGAA